MPKGSENKKKGIRKKKKNREKKEPLSRVKTILTAALPYANGPLHLGHMVEYVQADIYARFLRLIGQHVLFVCASDTHGTPIEVNAEKLGITPEQLVQKYHKEHKQDFASFGVSFDEFYTTHSKESRELSIFFFNRLKKKKLIYKKAMKVIFCSACGRNLPDRYVKGTCRNCGSHEQYGDICEHCGIAQKGTDLLNPKCVVCGKTPSINDAEHYFFKLSALEKQVKKWLDVNPNLQEEVKNSVAEWFTKGLEDWCISRDGPYFGFQIPNEKSLYFYVWLDAPIGYIAATKHYCSTHKGRSSSKLAWQEYWKGGKNRIIHIIGKDIIYFHFLFWPAMLIGAGFATPKDIVVHGYLTVNGEKMSKSRGTLFTVRDFLRLYPNHELLRFYYAHHLSKKLADVDLDFENFLAAVNNELVANVANFCYRVLSFAEKNYGGMIGQVAQEKELQEELTERFAHIMKNYGSFNFKQTLSEILEISSLGNTYFQKKEPWKDPAFARPAVGFCVQLVRNLAILLKPIMPQFCAELEGQLGENELKWKDLGFNFKGKINGAKIVLTKIENMPSLATFPLDLAVGKILAVKDHPNADSLYVLDVDLRTEKRQLVAGLKKHLEKGALLGKNIVVCRNMKPAKIRGVESDGMLLAADDGLNVSILEAPKSKPGDAVTLEGYRNSNKEITFEEFLKVNVVVLNGKVAHGGKHLKTAVEDIVVKGIKDKGKVR